MAYMHYFSPWLLLLVSNLGNLCLVLQDFPVWEEIHAGLLILLCAVFNVCHVSRSPSFIPWVSYHFSVFLSISLHYFHGLDSCLRFSLPMNTWGDADKHERQHTSGCNKQYDIWNSPSRPMAPTHSVTWFAIADKQLDCKTTNYLWYLIIFDNVLACG